MEWRYQTATAADGRLIRIGQTGPEEPMAEILILPGRGDLTAKYSEVAGAAAELGARTTVVNWRGQGGSERCDVPRGALHVDDFSEYLLDIRVMLNAVSPETPRLVLGYSMGGLIGLSAIASGQLRAERVVAVSPMLRFRMKSPEWFSSAVARAAVAMGNSRGWAAGERWIDPLDCVLESNMAVNDAEAFDALQLIRLREPDDLVTGATWGWTRAAVRAMASFRHMNLKRIEVPLTLFSSREDQSVDPTEHQRLASKWQSAQLVELTGRHDLMVEGGQTGTEVRAKINYELKRIL